MKKLLFTTLLGAGLLLPAHFSASFHSSSQTKERSTKKPKKTKSKTNRTSGSTIASYTRSYLSGKGCTYNGQQLYVGKKGGCYYYAGNSKKYVDRSYCASCK